MHHGIVGLHGSILLRNLYGNLRRYCAISVEHAAARNASRDSGSTQCNFRFPIISPSYQALLCSGQCELQQLRCTYTAATATRSRLPLHKYWIVTGFRHFPHICCLLIKYINSLCRQRVSETGDSLIFVPAPPRLEHLPIMRKRAQCLLTIAHKLRCLVLIQLQLLQLLHSRMQQECSNGQLTIMCNFGP